MLYLVTAPAAEPFDATEAKTYLKVGNSADDDVITEMIKAARGLAERYTGRAFITQTWEQCLDRIPSEGGEEQWEGIREGSISELHRGARFIDLEKAPILTIASFKYFDQADTETTLSSSVYGLDLRHTPGRVYLKNGQVWPVGLRDFDAIRIQFTAGYGATGASVPSDIKLAIKQTVASLYENRGDAEASAELPKAARDLLDPFVIRRFG